MYPFTMSTGHLFPLLFHVGLQVWSLDLAFSAASAPLFFVEQLFLLSLKMKFLVFFII